MKFVTLQVNIFSLILPTCCLFRLPVLSLNNHYKIQITFDSGFTHVHLLHTQDINIKEGEGSMYYNSTYIAYFYVIGTPVFNYVGKV